MFFCEVVDVVEVKPEFELVARILFCHLWKGTFLQCSRLLDRTAKASKVKASAFIRPTLKSAEMVSGEYVKGFREVESSELKWDRNL